MALSYGFCLDGTDSLYTSAQFSEAFQAVFGDGICVYGRQFELAAVVNFTVTIGTGYAIAAGRWLENDESLDLTLTPSSNYEDRYDAVAVRVDYEARKVSLEILTDVDPAAPPRNDKEYCLYLYLIYVKRGATVLDGADITDVREDKALCGYITPLAAISSDAEYIYQFLVSGIDQEVARLIARSGAIIQTADAAIRELDSKISAARGIAIGDTTTSLTRPLPENEWLLCDGSPVPEEYPALSLALGGVLPDLTAEDDRWATWIFGGTPV